MSDAGARIIAPAGLNPLELHVDSFVASATSKGVLLLTCELCKNTTAFDQGVPFALVVRVMESHCREDHPDADVVPSIAIAEAREVRDVTPEDDPGLD